MVGREGEQARLSALVKAAAGQTLVIRGEAGVGKSALLDYAVGLAVQNGHLVIRATGVEAESELPYAGLHQLLHPLLCDAVQPDDGWRAVFDAAFGQMEGKPCCRPLRRPDAGRRRRPARRAPAPAAPTPVRRPYRHPQ
ncbi:AAA family ATPase [Nonomuraea jabiensis]|uniref:AAA family ATPase n=1 Tax=Nonomuraea jabiensis TaxID=882448 RepID=UPI00368F2963